MQFQLLGPVEVTVEGRVIECGHAKQRCVLAVLLCEAGQVVSIEQLVDRLWDQDPPAEARNTLYTYITRLRRVLQSMDAASRGVELIRRSSGYALEVPGDVVDLHRFRRLVDRAHASADEEEKSILLRDALHLWKQQALAGLSGSWVVGMRARLDQERVNAALAYHDVQMRLGRAEQILSGLREMVAAHPLNEPLTAQLMTALSRCGRRPEALQLYESVRRRLTEELGVDPGPELQQLYQQLLVGAPGLGHHMADAPATSRRLTITGRGVLQEASLNPAATPCLLPAASGACVAREKDADALFAALTAGADARPAVAAISGPGGVGKTALAVQVAHRLREAFPDGQLYANLHGLQRNPTDPAHVLVRFLRVLGVATPAAAEDIDHLAEMYRSVLARRRILVVLDNAAGEAQLQSLLPGSPTCAVLITSRRRLTGLSGVHHAELPMFTRDEALHLMERIIGRDRVTAEPREAARLAKLCGGLPLAVRIAAARLAARPHWQLSQLTGRLCSAGSRLDELAHGADDVRATLAVAYHGLDDQDRCLFRRLGLVQAPDFTAWVGAALLDVEVQVAYDACERLADIRLLDIAGRDEAGNVRFRFHDLVRDFAREQAEAEEGEPEMADALARVPDCGTLSHSSRVRALFEAD
ncbi:AfsR/SARP family transcriptional regulator [Nonomuraea indica]|uniref:BTAD domain-containing putative transcriptional regulator n=1 Tax=Nonomuraea indica TaxID=1581193 RepID=A0ABW8AA20_9ACTN